MGFYALYRLLWRRAGILLALDVGLFTWFFLNEEALPFGWSEPFRLNLYTLAFPAALGCSLGLFTSVQHTPLFWTLPNLRRKLFSSVLFTGIIIAVLVTWVYVWFGGSAPWFPILTSGILWYSMGISVTAGDVPEGSGRRIRVFRVLSLLLLVLAGFLIDPIADLYKTQPLPCVLLTMVGASLFLNRTFDVDAARRKSLVPLPDFSLSTLSTRTARSIEKEVMAAKRTSTRKWQRTGPLTGVSDWIRASEYENFGADRGGWAARAALVSGIAALAVLSNAYLLDYLLADAKERDRHEVLQLAQALVSLVPAFCAMGLWFNRSFFLQKGWLYPLSRAQLARLAYWGSLLSNAVINGIMLLTLFFVESLIDIYAEYDFNRPITLFIICIPLLQWLHLRYGLRSYQPFAVFGPAFLAIPFLSWFWLDAASSISDTYETAACAGLILLSQSLYRYRLETYFRKADLI